MEVAILLLLALACLALFGKKSKKKESGKTKTLKGRTCSNGRKVIRRNSIPFWKERGWLRKKEELHGYYRVNHRAYEGKIRNPFSERPRFYILKPPEEILQGPHGVCFVPRGKNVYWIHISPKPESLNVGIKSVENCLSETV